MQSTKISKLKCNIKSDNNTNIKTTLNSKSIKTTDKPNKNLIIKIMYDQQGEYINMADIIKISDFLNK